MMRRFLPVLLLVVLLLAVAAAWAVPPPKEPKVHPVDVETYITADVIYSPPSEMGRYLYVTFWIPKKGSEVVYVDVWCDNPDYESSGLQRYDDDWWYIELEIKASPEYPYTSDYTVGCQVVQHAGKSNVYFEAYEEITASIADYLPAG